MKRKFKINDKVRTTQFAGVIVGSGTVTGDTWKVRLFDGQGWPAKFVYVHEKSLTKIQNGTI